MLRGAVVICLVFSYAYGMSKGPGRVQRRILDVLRPHNRSRHRFTASIRYLARHVYGDHPTPAQLSSVRRAVRGLVRDGKLSEVEPSPDADTLARQYVCIEGYQPRRRIRHTYTPTTASPGLSVTYTAPCGACGADAQWLHTWDDRHLVSCPSCST